MSDTIHRIYLPLNSNEPRMFLCLRDSPETNTNMRIPMQGIYWKSTPSKDRKDMKKWDRKRKEVKNNNKVAISESLCFLPITWSSSRIQTPLEVIST